MRKALGLFLLVAAACALPALAQPDAPPLFRDAFVKASPMEDDPAVLRTRAVTADVSLLLPRAGGVVPAKTALRLRLDLFPDVEVTAALEAHVEPLQSYVAWRGYLEGVPESVVTFVASNGQIAGNVRTLQRTYRIRFVGEPSVYAIDDIDFAMVSDEAEPLTPDPADLAAAEPPAKSFDDGSTIDVLVVYTPAASEQAGGSTAIENAIKLALDETNVILERSRSVPRVRLVKVAKVDYTEVGTDIFSDLEALRRGNGALEEAHTLRDTYKADIVAMVRRSSIEACGIGYLMGDAKPPDRTFQAFAYSVTALPCLANSTLPHEMGHNWGCNHSRQDPIGRGAYPYSYGYKNPDNLFRTIMAYDCPGGCQRILNYSNPEVFAGDTPTGAANANNALSITNVRSIIANFRLSDPSASCSGSAGKFLGCQGTACAACAEKLTAYPLYFFNHPDCNVNYACSGRKYGKCSTSCPPPKAADACTATKGQWKGCGTNACAVCSDLLADFPHYLQNHPGCTRDVACGSRAKAVCNARCPAPSDGDR